MARNADDNPFDMEPYAPAEALEAMTAPEHLAFIRLARLAWCAEDACSLPLDGVLLARWSRLTADEWAAANKGILAAFTIDGDRIRLPKARAIWDRRRATERNVSDRNRANIAKRWERAPHPPDRPGTSRIPVEYDTYTSGIRLEEVVSGAGASAETRARAERSRSSAPPPQDKFKSALGAQSAEVLAEMKSDGARALAKAKIAEWRDNHVRTMLRDFVAHLRETGKTDVPMSKADELAQGQWSTPERVDCLIVLMKDRMAAKACPRPVGYLISGLGLDRRRGRKGLITVRPEYIATWGKKEAQYAQQIAATVATAAAIAERQEAARARKGGARDV